MSVTFGKLLVAAIGVMAFGLSNGSKAISYQIETTGPTQLESAVRDTYFFRVATDQMKGAVANPLGITAMPAAPELVSQLGLDQPVLLLSSVPEECPGYTGGLRTFDVILQVADTKPESPEKLDELLGVKAGESVSIVLIRKAEQMELQLDVPPIAEFSIDFAVDYQPESAAATPASAYRLGVVLANVDDALRSHLGLAASQGVLVTEVSEDSPAAKVGCEPNDILLDLDGQSIESEVQLRELVQKIADREVVLKLMRRGKNIEVKITPKLETDMEVSFSRFEIVPQVQGDVLYLAPVIDRSVYQLPVQYQPLFLDLKVDGAGTIMYSPFVPGQASVPSETAANQVMQLKNHIAELQGKLSELLTTVDKLEKNLGDSQSKSP